MNKIYKLKVNDCEYVEIEPNHDSYRCGDTDVIWLSVNNDEEECATGISIEQAKELISYLNEVISYIEYSPKIGELINIIGGKFQGFSGKIFDIDKVASVREATIEIPKTNENDLFYAYVNLSDLEIIRQ
jgi:ribosomal protein S4E